MNSEQDCTSIRQQAIATFCNDLGAVIGILGSCSDILSKTAKQALLDDERDILEIIEIVQVHQQGSESMFSGAIDYMKSKSENCEAILSDIIDQANIIFQEDYKTWYKYFKQLEIHYLETHELDTKLTGLLVHHAYNLGKFHQKLRDEETKFHG